MIFDAGLTLIKSATPAEDVAAEVLGSSGSSAGYAEIKAAMQHAEHSLERRWHKDDWWISESAVRELFVAAYTEGLATVPDLGDRSPSPADLAELIYDAYQDTRHWTTYDDVLPTLERLRRAEIHMGIVSDWGHGLEAIVLELELTRYFEFLVVSSRLGVSKPDPSVFQMALGRIGVAPENAIYIGDTYVKDVLGARAAGLTPVLLDREARLPAVDCLKVQGLDELLALLHLDSAPIQENRQ